jgi:TolB protein
MNADGSGATNLTRNPYEDNYPAWSTDGASLYFVSFRDGTAQIYSVPAQGGEQRRLTRNGGYDLMIRPQVAQAPGPRTEKMGLAAATNPISMH